jgi:hypothetical protein
MLTQVFDFLVFANQDIIWTLLIVAIACAAASHVLPTGWPPPASSRLVDRPVPAHAAVV